MNVLFELLFHAWCPPYNPEKLPDYLRKDPVHGYGQYTFERGFQLGLCLAVTCLTADEMQALE